MDMVVVRMVSPHAGLLFRERMYTVLNTAPRVTCVNSRSGFFEIETVWQILQEMNAIIDALHLPIDIDGNVRT